MVTSGLSLVGKVCPMPILQKSRGLLVTCCYLVGSTYVTHILLGVGQKQIDKKNIYICSSFLNLLFLKILIINQKAYKNYLCQ
jgi:hypothetical protein